MLKWLKDGFVPVMDGPRDFMDTVFLFSCPFLIPQWYLEGWIISPQFFHQASSSHSCIGSQLPPLLNDAPRNLPEGLHWMGVFLDSKLSWQDHILFCWRSRRCLRLLQACISWGSHWKMHYLHITLILSTFNYGSYSASASLLTPWYNLYCCLLCISRCLLILQLRSSIVNQGYHPIFDIVLFSWRSCAHFHQFSHSILSSYLCLPTLSLLIGTLLNLFTHSSSHILSSFCPNFPSQYQCLCRWP